MLIIDVCDSDRRKEEPGKSYLDQPVQERLKVVSDFLQGESHSLVMEGGGLFSPTDTWLIVLLLCFSR